MQGPPISERRVRNGTVVLHALSNIAGQSARIAVAIVPGLSESAEDWRFVIEALSPLGAAAVSLRGRGAGAAPAAGYSLLDHCSDIAAFVESLPAPRVIVVAFSRSVSYALEYAIGRPPKLAGLVLLDYPPRHTALPSGWAAAIGESNWRGRRVSQLLSSSVLAAIEREAEAKDFSHLLPQIGVPTLVVRGGAAGAALSASDGAVYAAGLPNCNVVQLEDASHALWEPEPEALTGLIASFVAKVDAGDT